jgi:hypothetical protein
MYTYTVLYTYYVPCYIDIFITQVTIFMRDTAMIPTYDITIFPNYKSYPIYIYVLCVYIYIKVRLTILQLFTIFCIVLYVSFVILHIISK